MILRSIDLHWIRSGSVKAVSRRVLRLAKGMKLSACVRSLVVMLNPPYLSGWSYSYLRKFPESSIEDL